MQTIPNCEIYSCTVHSPLSVVDGPLGSFDDEYLNDLRKIHNEQTKPVAFKYGYNFTEVTLGMLGSSLCA